MIEYNLNYKICMEIHMNNNELKSKPFYFLIINN